MKSRLFSALAIALLAGIATAQDAEATTWSANSPDTVWILLCSVLVLLMTPALAFFYGGLAKRKNVVNTMMMSFVALGVASILWFTVGYSLAFGSSTSGLIGSGQFLFGKGVSVERPYVEGHTIPNGLFMLFQMMFAIITPALISGAVAERMKFWSYVAFISLWSVLVYAPVACWVWNPNGWLFQRGALDFAGGTVVHLASGVSALACVMVLGKRNSVKRDEAHEPHNLTYTLLGAGLLWVGWIGFNAGSALSAGPLAISAFISTHLAAAAGMIGWIAVEAIRKGKATSLGAASGLVAGLVGITPAAGFVEPGAGIIIGLVAGAGCCLAVELKKKLSYDDAFDVVGVHGFGGAIGAILTGVLASEALAPAVKDKGRMMVIAEQFVAVGAVAVFSFVVSIAIMKGLGLVGKLRSTASEEEQGLDLAEHAENGYVLEEPLVFINDVDWTEGDKIALVPVTAEG